MLAASLFSFSNHSCERVQAAIQVATDEEINFAEPIHLYTPLHYACQMCNSGACIEELLRRGALPNIEDRMGTSPLMHLCRKYHTNHSTYLRLAEILLRHGAMPSLTEKGFSCIHYLALNDQCEMLSMMLRYVDDIHKLETTEGETPLHIAAKFVSLNACRILIDAGFDLDRNNHFRVTPLASLLGRGYPWYGKEIECGRFLIDRGAKLENIASVEIPGWAHTFAQRRRHFQNHIFYWILTTRKTRLLRIIGHDMVREIALEIWSRRLQ